MESSKIFLLNKDKKFLLSLRDNKIKIPYSGYWDLVGGEIEREETPIQAVKRECLEEIGEVPENIISIGEIIIPKHYLLPYESHSHIFRGKINTPIERLRAQFNKSNEGQDIAYFDFEDLETLKFPYFWISFIHKNKKLFNLK